MERIRVLAVAPYSGLKTLMTEIAEEWDNLDLQVHVGDLEEGVRLADSLQDKGYDIILSRGGTAGMIEKIAHIPVVEIQLSEYDILHAIQLAQSYAGKFVVVGFPNIIERIKVICRLMRYQVDTCVVRGAEEVPQRLGELKGQGYSLVVGDAVTVSTAREMQINGILITTGRESVITAFYEVVKIYKAMAMARNQNLFFKDILNRSQMGVLVYGADKELLYSNLWEKEALDDYMSVSKNILPYLDRILQLGSASFMRKSKGYLWQIQGERGKAPFEHCVYIFIKRTIDITLLDKAISYHDMLEQFRSPFHPFYDNAESIRKILATASKISETQLPVLIFGERGTGKDTLALAIHKGSPLRNFSFLSINCRMLKEKQLNQLLVAENSPLGETGMTICFKNIHSLNESACRALVTYLRDTSLHRRNRLIYTCEAPPSAWEENLLVAYLLHEDDWDCTTLCLPSLRERREDIPSLASIYINELNIQLGKQVAGLDDESIRLLEEFPWLFNIDQFIKVLRELMLITADAFIQAEDTRRVLQKEELFSTACAGTDLLDGTLEEITAKIINAVFQQEGMNQTRTAKRLGISRSTMWRKLQP